METFAAVIEFIMKITVVIVTVQVYFQLNKLWKRKHERVVAESVSLISAILVFCVHIPMAINHYALSGQYSAAINSTIIVGNYAVMFAIGTGKWVPENKGIKFGKLVRRALNLEKNESGHLLKSIVQPPGADKLIKILEQTSAIDNEISEEEIKMINEFADRWNITPPEMVAGKGSGEVSLLDVRRSTEDYLAINPPKEQAANLVDLLEMIIKADNQVTEEEEIILAELSGLINNYVQEGDEEVRMHEVIIVPQKDGQENAIKTLLPNAEPVQRRGGTVFTAGEFYSKKYAESICDRYIDLGLFSVTHEVTVQQKAA